ncbi:MAG: GntR family transcriptional regulator [Gaiellaceae bacterium]
MPPSQSAAGLGRAEATPLSAGGSHRTLAEKAYVELHARILSGELAPGERLRIDVLAALLEMSPMPIREALNRLSAAGLVDHAPHRATRVAELSLDDLAEVYEARLALEPLAVRLAAERFTPADENAARDALGAYEERLEGDPAALWAAHTGFHYALYAAAGSQWLLRLITPLWETTERYRRASLPTERSPSERAVEHERMLAACVARDGEAAARETHAHLSLTANMMAQTMGSDSPLFAPGG